MTGLVFMNYTSPLVEGYILLMLGIPIYLFMRWRHQRDRTLLRTELYELPELPKEAPAMRERLSR